MTEFYDRNASPLLNSACAEAISFINRVIEEDTAHGHCGCREFDLSAICLWSAQTVAPKFTPEQHQILAEAAAKQVQAVDRALKGALAA